MYPLRSIVTCAVALSTAGLQADEDEVDRARDFDQAIVGDTAVLLERGELEVRFEASYEDADDLDTVELLVGMDYGLTDWLELSIEVPYLFAMPVPEEEHDVDGLGDIKVGGALAVLAEHPVYVSTSLDVDLPTGNDERSEHLGEGRVVWEPSVVTDLALGDAELVFDIGGAFAEHQSEFLFETTLAYALGEIVPSLGVEGSLDGGAKEISIVPGIGLPIGEDVELAIEVPIGLSHDAANWKVLVEVTFGF